MVDAVRYILVAFAIVNCILLVARPSWGLAGMVALLPFVGRFLPKFGPGLNVETVLVMFALVAVLLHARPALPPLRVLAPFLAYYAISIAGLAILNTWLTADFAGSFMDRVLILKFALWPTLLFFVAYALATRVEQRRTILVLLTGGLVIFAVTGYIDMRRGALTAGQDTLGMFEVAGKRTGGVLAANPNILGAHLAMLSIIPLMGALRRENGMILRAGYAAAYLIASGVLVLTLSRGSWIAFIGAHGMFLFLRHRRMLIPVAGAAVLVLGLAAATGSLPKNVQDRIEATLTPGSIQRSGLGRFDGSVDTRVALHTMGISMFKDSPLWGHGFAAFAPLASVYGTRWGFWTKEGHTSPESTLLRVATEHGLLGLMIMAWMAWGLAIRGIVVLRRGQEKDLATAFLCAFTAASISALTLDAYHTHEVSLFLWLLAGLTARAYLFPLQETEPAPALVQRRPGHPRMIGAPV